MGLKGRLAALPENRPKSAFFALFRRVGRAHGKSRKRRKRPFSSDILRFALAPIWHLLNPHLRHPNFCAIASDVVQMRFGCGSDVVRMRFGCGSDVGWRWFGRVLRSGADSLDEGKGKCFPIWSIFQGHRLCLLREQWKIASMRLRVSLPGHTLPALACQHAGEHCAGIIRARQEIASYTNSF